MLIQSTELVAGREQLLSVAVMLMIPVPPLAVKLAAGGERENEHCCANAGMASHTASRKKRTQLLETL